MHPSESAYQNIFFEEYAIDSSVKYGEKNRTGRGRRVAVKTPLLAYMRSGDYLTVHLERKGMPVLSGVCLALPEADKGALRLLSHRDK